MRAEMSFYAKVKRVQVHSGGRNNHCWAVLGQSAMRRVHQGYSSNVRDASQNAVVRAERVGSEVMRGEIMRATVIASAAFTPLSVAAVAIATAATALAANPTEGGFGTREQLFDGGEPTRWRDDCTRPTPRRKPTRAPSRR